MISTSDQSTTPPLILAMHVLHISMLSFAVLSNHAQHPPSGVQLNETVSGRNPASNGIRYTYPFDFVFGALEA